MPRTLFAPGQQALDVVVWRKDGWNGPIDLTVEGFPRGVSCAPQTVGPGLGQSRLVISASEKVPSWTGEIRVKGTAMINGQTVVREARAASINWQVAQNSLPTITRFERRLVASVRDEISSPFTLTTTVGNSKLRPGDKAMVTLKLDRHWEDAKAPLQVLGANLPPNLTFTPVTLAPDQKEAKGVIAVDTKATPGTYAVVLWGQTQAPFARDPQQKKQAITVQMPASPLLLTIAAD
jgi:hypothetical protein